MSGRRKREADSPSPNGRRFLHSAVSMENYMLVLGGKTAADDDVDSREVALIYVYQCQMWIRVDLESSDVMRRTGHSGGTAATVGADGHVYVIGGYQYSRDAFISQVYLI